MQVFPSPGKNSSFRVISGYYLLFNPFNISSAIARQGWHSPCNLEPHQRGTQWVNVGRPGGTKYTCHCRFADRGAVRQSSIRLIFETSRGPVCTSIQKNQLIQGLPLNSRSPYLQTRTEARRFWFEPVPKLCAYRRFPGKWHRFTEWLSQSTESILSDPLLPTRQRSRSLAADAC
jgi:hypothetical protein